MEDLTDCIRVSQLLRERISATIRPSPLLSPQYTFTSSFTLTPKASLRNHLHNIQSYLSSSSDSPNLMSSLSPFVKSSFDTSPPPNESLSFRAQPDPHQLHIMCANSMYLLQLLLLRYANNPAAHASLLRSAFAFKGPKGNASFVEPEGLAQDISTGLI